MKHEKAKKRMKRFYHATLGAILVAGAFMIYAMQVLPVSDFPGTGA
ncbi:hypothetical protein OG339_43425 [Streptosporangium sp. NBC_01495]|nr:hypothetical protein [Streptosporangium sp. NBC_01495]